MLNPNDPNLNPPFILFLLPCYGGQVTESCFYSFLKFAKYAETTGIEYIVATHTHTSLISLGRSIMLSQAVQDVPEWTHVMWVDADIEWEPEHIMMLLAEDKDIIGGPYPCKTYPLKHTSASKPIKGGEETDSLIETYYVATGFMMIKRHVCEAMMKHYEDELKFRYSTKTHGSRKFVDLFAPIIEADNNDLYLTEDYAFCKRAKQIGFQVYMSKRFQLGHTMGSYVFSKEKENKMLKEYEDQGKIKILDSSVNI